MEILIGTTILCCKVSFSTVPDCHSGLHTIETRKKIYQNINIINNQNRFQIYIFYYSEKIIFNEIYCEITYVIGDDMF